MTHSIGDMPDTQRADQMFPGRWWHRDETDDRIVCDLCPRECRLKSGDRGFCFVRENCDGEMVLSTYGRSTGFCIDPIEKKPLNHFLPGTSVLSFGTAGCNLGCKFCQNWDISKSREVERLSQRALPDAIALAALSHQCRSVAFTYNDPVVWAEYAIDTARACRAAGIKTVAVTAGYISKAARAEFFEFMDATNVDLKGFTDDFYQHLTLSHLQPVLDTLEWLKKETNVWFEITNLIIPEANDSPVELQKMCDWILEHVGDEVPIHFSAFHPDFKMKDIPNTPKETLLAAYDIARKTGLKHVYVGNVHDVVHQSTYCPNCHDMVIERDWYALGGYHLRGDSCSKCGRRIAGVFDNAPGTWGRRRQPVDISSFNETNPLIQLTSPRKMAATGDEKLPKVGLPQHQVTTRTVVSRNPSKSESQMNVSELKSLDQQQEESIHHATCLMLMDVLLGRVASFGDPTLKGAASQMVMGAFVTLKRRGHLRACCGSLGVPMELGQALKNATLRTATADSRFPTISVTELPFLVIDVTLLFNFQPMLAKGASRVRAFEIGRHGLRIQRDRQSGLLLPSVAIEHRLDAEGFLMALCRKAGLPSDAWKEDATHITTFEGYVIDGPFDRDLADNLESSAANGAASNLMAVDHLRKLAAHCRANIMAFLSGSAPNYYAIGCADGSVPGIVLSVSISGRQTDLIKPISNMRFNVRQKLPLQATLFELSQSVAQTLATKGGISQSDAANLEVSLAILSDPAMHGTAADRDLRGIESQSRGLMVMDGDRFAFDFNQGSTPDQLAEAAVKHVRPKRPEAASVLSFQVVSTKASIHASNVSSSEASSGIRPPAVAGRFYPENERNLFQLIDDLLSQPINFNSTDHATTKSFVRAIDSGNGPVQAILVPHAGLIYSGRIAATVFRQVEMPETVIVIGPKHTRFGAEWAVAPNAFWSLPGVKIENDVSLSRRLVEAIPGLQFDEAAHAHEHSIEVELPFLNRIAPQTKVVGIVIGTGDLGQLKKFANALASFLKTLPQSPLLIISSDMNHFADDDETRRRDELALKCLDRMDADALWMTCRDNDISMCGVRPAVIVLETLRLLGTLSWSRRVGYATSADQSKETSRTVGYAGMVFGG